MPRRSSHWISFGTISAAAGELGFEITPTVLMMGIEEKLLVPFRAENRAFNNRCFESQCAHGAVHALASSPVDLRVANNPSFADLPPARFELRLDQYNHLAAG